MTEEQKTWLELGRLAQQIEDTPTEELVRKMAELASVETIATILDWHVEDVRRNLAID